MNENIEKLDKMRHSQEEVVDAINTLIQKDSPNSAIIVEYIEDLANICKELTDQCNIYEQMIIRMLRRASEINTKKRKEDIKRQFLRKFIEKQKIEKEHQKPETLGEFKKE